MLPYKPTFVWIKDYFDRIGEIFIVLAIENGHEEIELETLRRVEVDKLRLLVHERAETSEFANVNQRANKF